MNCYSTVVQNELYLFGTQNNWDQDHSGQTETLGTEVDAVGLEMCIRDRAKARHLVPL